jgi:hypothetical protein
MRLPAVILATLLAACGSTPGGDGDGDGDGQPPPADVYGPAFATIALEIDYQTGAEPFTGGTVGTTDVWDLFGANAERLFQDAGKTLEFPRALADMEELTDVSGASFTVAAILDVAAAHRDDPSVGDRATYYVLFVDGLYDDGTGDQPQVLGVSIGDTGVVAMFKPVIESTDVTLLPAVVRFVEQTVLIHEFGHAVGLVARGVPLTSAHHDEPHGAHCSDDACVMYYANEGASDLAQFVQDSVITGDTIVFGPECLADTDALIAASN